MTENQSTARGLSSTLAVVALVLLAPSLVNGLHCPLPDPSSSSDLGQYVSLCALCSHNEAAVRWNRTVGNHLEYFNFYMRYECYDTDGNIVIPKEYGDDSVHDCPWIGTIYPSVVASPSFGIASAGRELSNGTTCNFELIYRISANSERARTILKQSSCTVGGGCEGDECRIDRVCTFSNGTQGAEEGLCTECSCSEGYSGPGCANINECAGNHTCDTNADCIDTDGSYWCQCLSGFTGDGYICTDINECENVTCGENATCNNTNGSYRCECDSGFSGDGYNCTNINECADGSNGCDTNADCIDTDGSYWCQCHPGFAGDGYNCTDINECENVTCGENGECINTEGNYRCQCKSGFTGDGYIYCIDIDDCQNVTCGESATCIDMLESYSCQCDSGFTGDGHNCTDTDECVEHEHNDCGSNVDCFNTEGSYSCQCKSGFTGDGFGCTDVNECDNIENVTCSEDAECMNTEGSYSCQCKSGFTGDGYNCTDINDCESVTCGENGECIDGEGSYSCHCKSGFTGDGYNCRKELETAEIVGIATSVLVVAMIVFLLPVLLFLKIYRPKPITFEDMTVKELDPFYSPKMWGRSVMSIHSEYECLYTMTPSHSTEKMGHFLENGTGDEADHVIQETASHSSEESVDLKKEEPVDKDNFERSGSTCMSGNDDSCPYIDEGSLGNPHSTENILHPHKGNISESSTDSGVDPLGEQGDDDSCSMENSSSMFEHSSHSHMMIPSGYVELAQGVKGFEPCEPSAFQPVPNVEEIEENEEEGKRGESGEVENSKIDLGTSGGYVISAGVENDEEKSNDDEQSHTTYIFTEGCDMTGFTSFDEPTFTSSDPNYIHDSCTINQITPE